MEIFLKPLKTFHSNLVKVPRPLVALALAKNLDSVGPWCETDFFVVGKMSVDLVGFVKLVGVAYQDLRKTTIHYTLLQSF